MSNSIYGLLEFYTSSRKVRGDGELFDLKYVQLLMKGIFGFFEMAEVDAEIIDWTEPKMQLVKGKLKKDYPWNDVFNN